MSNRIKHYNAAGLAELGTVFEAVDLESAGPYVSGTVFDLTQLYRMGIFFTVTIDTSSTDAEWSLHALLYGDNDESTPIGPEIVLVGATPATDDILGTATYSGVLTLGPSITAAYACDAQTRNGVLAATANNIWAAPKMALKAVPNVVGVGTAITLSATAELYRIENA